MRVCADCVSSIGTVDVNLTEVYLASCASGKAIGSYAGVAVVFANPADLAHLDPDAIPSYLDVAATLGTTGPRFTFPSPMIRALDAALEAFVTPETRAARYRRLADTGGYLRSRLAGQGHPGKYGKKRGKQARFHARECPTVNCRVDNND